MSIWYLQFCSLVVLPAWRSGSSPRAFYCPADFNRSAAANSMTGIEWTLDYVALGPSSATTLPLALAGSLRHQYSPCSLFLGSSALHEAAVCIDVAR